MSTTPALEIRNLRFRYASEDLAAGSASGHAPWTVDVAALALQPGEQVLLTAGSGVGKSTLLHLIAGILDPLEGHVIVAGEDVHQRAGAARDAFRGRHIGMIFQTFNLLHGFTALENVMAAMMFSSIPRAEHAPRAAALLTHLGITRHTQTPEQQSVGMQQRVAVARALACDPALVLADEPTASLDPDNASAAIELIQSACREKNAALLCVSHDPSMRQRFSPPAGSVKSLPELRSC
ncbi:MAG: ABC transporter ATP-binding protein [Phycisphaerales bacterium]